MLREISRSAALFGLILYSALAQPSSADAGLPAVAGGQIATRFVSEEHMGIRLPADSSLRRGDRVLVVAGYAPTTVNLHGVLFVGSGGVVVDVWPIRARHGTADAM